MAFNPRDPKTQKLILAGMFVGAVLYVNFFTEVAPFTYKANASELEVLGENYRSLSKDLTKARQTAHQLPFLEKEYALLHQKWEQGRSFMPEKVEMTSLLRTLTIIGTQSGIEFVKFRPLPPKPAQDYTENPIEIEVVGGYHQVGSFLAEIANLERIVNVQHLLLETNKDARTRDEKPSHAAFTAVAYTLGGAPATDAQPAAVARKGAKPALGEETEKAKAPAKKTREKKGPSKANPDEPKSGDQEGGNE